jgi:hypothetical protein
VTFNFPLPFFNSSGKESFGSHANYGFIPYSAHHAEQMNPDEGIVCLRLPRKTRENNSLNSIVMLSSVKHLATPWPG